MADIFPFRTGFGYDSHRLAAGRDLILCGKKIVHEKGLLGHSDADAPVHALIDAVLGAMALGDIGRHFPDTDERYRGADSIALLKHVMNLPELRGWAIGNLDLTIIAQEPKLASHMEDMRRNLAEALSLELTQVSIKAKTAEHLGPVGNGEAIEAYAAVMIYSANN